MMLLGMNFEDAKHIVYVNTKILNTDNQSGQNGFPRNSGTDTTYLLLTVRFKTRSNSTLILVAAGFLFK